MEKDIRSNLRVLNNDEVNSVSGGFWNIVGAIALVVIGCIAEGVRHRADPDPLKGFGKED